MTGRGRAVLATMVVLAGAALVGSSLLQRRAAAPDAGGGTGIRSGVSERVRVEVLNAGGVSGAARAATDTLRDAGFDVVYFGNAQEFGRDSTLVVDRVGRPEMAEDVAAALGGVGVASLPDPNLYLDVSVWLGTDWPPAGAGEPAAGEPERPWWDPRGWLSRSGSPDPTPRRRGPGRAATTPSTRAHG